MITLIRLTIPFDFRVRKNFEIKCTSVETMSRWVIDGGLDIIKKVQPSIDRLRLGLTKEV